MNTRSKATGKSSSKQPSQQNKGKFSALPGLSWLTRPKQKARISVIYFDGIIHSNPNHRGGITSRAYLPIIRKACKLRNRAAVSLVINSPGGSPAQSLLLGEAIRFYADKYKVKVYAFCEDVAASGGYWLAAVADQVYALPTSVIGSIGVISAGFGFPELLRKIGVERRVYTAGDNKSILDPFAAEKPADVAHIKKLQQQMHDLFIAHVRKQRNGKLPDNSDSKKLFSGLFWLGEEAQQLGLVDDLGSMNTILTQEFGPDFRLKQFRPKRAAWYNSVAVQANRPAALLEQIDEMMQTSQYRL